MASDRARRGRPRGSGLDDGAQLRRVTALLEADPALKPTTAIKAIGVSDPSSIRRLREKLKVLPARPASVARARSEGEPTPAPLSQQATAHDGAPALQRPAVTAASAASASGGLAAVNLFDVQDAWLAQWCALGLSAMSSSVEAQMTAMSDFLRFPQIESALRQQLLFNEVAKAFCPKRSDVRSTLH